MSKMFINNADHYGFIKQCIKDKPEHVLISTFGIYAGVTYDGRDTTEWGSSYSLETREIIDVLKDIDTVRFLVGVSDYRSCRGKLRCKDCERTYAQSLLRLGFHAEKFPWIEWKISTELHLKCSLFFYDMDCSSDKAKGIAGGRNFTNSSWADITFELTTEQIEQLHTHVAGLWDESLDATDENLGAIFEKQSLNIDDLF